MFVPFESGQPGGSHPYREKEGQMISVELWTYRDAMVDGTKLIGYSVEAMDGGIGKVDDATNDVGASYVVVDTGPWIFGKKVMIPAGVIDRVDNDDETVYVSRTKDEIKNAPEFDESRYGEDAYRQELGGYYGAPRRDEPL
jgi:hypothetical protein